MIKTLSRNFILKSYSYIFVLILKVFKSVHHAVLMSLLASAVVKHFFPLPHRNIMLTTAPATVCCSACVFEYNLAALSLTTLQGYTEGWINMNSLYIHQLLWNIVLYVLILSLKVDSNKEALHQKYTFKHIQFTHHKEDYWGCDTIQHQYNVCCGSEGTLTSLRKKMKKIKWQWCHWSYLQFGFLLLWVNSSHCM